MSDRLFHALQWSAVYSGAIAPPQPIPIKELLRKLHFKGRDILFAENHPEAVAFVGCESRALRAWIAGQFEDGMDWSNHGQWHIDHIRPCASFDLWLPTEQLKCWHYTNLQPLWKEDNGSKGSLYEGKRHRHKPDRHSQAVKQAAQIEQRREAMGHGKRR